VTSITVGGKVLMGFILDKNVVTCQINLLPIYSSNSCTSSSYSITSTLLLHIHTAAHAEVSLIAPSLNKGLTTTDYNMLFSSKLPGLCTCPFIFLPLLRLTELHCPKISLTWGCRPLLKLSILSPLSSSLIGPVYSYNVY
jgi:hypothetical protein